LKNLKNFGAKMKLNSHTVIVRSVNPKTEESTIIEVTNLLAIPITFYDFEAINSDEIKPVQGYLTMIGGRTYRMQEVPAEQLQDTKEGVTPLMVMVPWDQLTWKNGDPNDKRPPPAPPEMKPDELE
jgi:hypothetical protein